MNKSDGGGMNNNVNNPTRYDFVPSKGTGVNKSGNSYAKVVKGVTVNDVDTAEKPPTMILDDDCLVSKDISNLLFGRIKEFASLEYIKMALSNEGFADITIKYIGEFWVMLKFAGQEACKKFRDNVSTRSWFSILVDATLEFHIDKRIVWVEIEGIPFKLWT